jgi:hypothetical protein
MFRVITESREDMQGLIKAGIDYILFKNHNKLNLGKQTMSEKV